MLTPTKRQALRDGIVIPAHPLALTVDLKLDEPAQRGLTRYYRDAGVGGLAVGVHTTQFEIRGAGLYERVLRLAIEESTDPMVMVAGVLGPTRQAVGEATVARGLGYDLALVATPGWGEAGDAEILAGVAQVAEVMPVCGFYIQPAIGKRRFGFDFWRAFAQIDGVVAIKIAPFDRYATIDVVRAVVEAGRASDIALYTGNDDNIVVDLLTPFRFGRRRRAGRAAARRGPRAGAARWTDTARPADPRGGTHRSQRCRLRCGPPVRGKHRRRQRDTHPAGHARRQLVPERARATLTGTGCGDRQNACRVPLGARPGVKPAHAEGAEATVDIVGPRVTRSRAGLR
jgi:hypothetical protein